MLIARADDDLRAADKLGTKQIRQIRARLGTWVRPLAYAIGGGTKTLRSDDQIFASRSAPGEGPVSMSVLFRLQNPNYLIPIHPDNTRSKDWMILLEANTIVANTRARLRVARTSQERQITRRLASMTLRPFLVVEGFDPRIHILIFCPQLYKYDHDGKLVPLQGDEIGEYVAGALSHKAAMRRPWYDPIESRPAEPLLTEPLLSEFDTLLIEPPGPPSILPAPRETPTADQDRETTLVH
jgi:hypothetical protein